MTAYLVGKCCCKCYVTVKFRIKLSNRPGYGGVAFPDTVDIEIYSSGGALLYSGQSLVTSQQTNRIQWGNLTAVQTDSNRDLIVANDFLWMPGQESGTFHFDASDIYWNDAVTQFCEGTGLKDTLEGGPLAFADEYTIEPGPFQMAIENWAWTQWHEVELCEP